MRTIQGDAAAGAEPAASLRLNFALTFTGNAVYAAGQWAILSLIAKLGGGEMLGQYALAVAVATPVMMMAHLNLRAVLATDVEARRPFGDYLAVRLAATAAGLAALGALALLMHGASAMSGLILLAGLSLSADTVSDAYYGAMQRRDQMTPLAVSMCARGVLAAGATGLALWTTGSLGWALAALVAARLLLIAVYDRPQGLRGETPGSSGAAGRRAILRAALPLGAVLMLVSLNTNLPRYAIERYLGTEPLGAFAATASFLAIGSTVVNALGQAATPKLVRAFRARERSRFIRLTLRLSVFGLALGAAGVVGAIWFGPFVLRLLFRPEYAAHAGLLVAVMAASAPIYAAIVLGFAVTSTRTFAPQMLLSLAAAATSGTASFLLVPRFGLRGAALALAASGCVQIAGQAGILAHAVGRKERAA